MFDDDLDCWTKSRAISNSQRYGSALSWTELYRRLSGRLRPGGWRATGRTSAVRNANELTNDMANSTLTTAVTRHLLWRSFPFGDVLCTELCNVAEKGWSVLVGSGRTGGDRRCSKAGVFFVSPSIQLG